ncbi:exopolysaccharide biosynthesis protein [Raoultibacter phocaeensis]|uniref:exopolysaccharide biosynthesis protein n=1 Tax=Raoultibacter phocaeensis TaxID=2479841 RepID=UPI0011187938|nr:exopolysaccharide biosynthesis protein [Raoultibacter phocaeensis]
MAEANNESTVFEIAYGTEGTVDRDVDLFETFYAGYFKEKALARLVARARSRNRILFLALCIGGVLLAIPMAINASSIFAVILLAMGIALFGIGLYFAYRMVTAERYCKEHFGRLLDNEFAATRSVTKRVFDVRFTEQSVTVQFGSQTSIKQTRSKRYEDIAGVYVTDELVFIEGLTWLARFQLDERTFETMAALLQERCRERFHDWTERG